MEDHTFSPIPTSPPQSTPSQPTRSFFEFIVYFFTVLFAVNNEFESDFASEEEVLSSSFQPGDLKPVNTTTTTTTTTTTKIESNEFRIEISTSSSSVVSRIPDCCCLCSCCKQCFAISRSQPNGCCWDTCCCIVFLPCLFFITGFNPDEVFKMNYCAFQSVFLVKSIFDFPFKHPFITLISIVNMIVFSVTYSYYPLIALQMSVSLNTIFMILFALYKVLNKGHNDFHRHYFPHQDDPFVPSHPTDLSKWENLLIIIKCFRRLFRKCLCTSVNASFGCCLCCYKVYQEGDFNHNVAHKHPFYH
jgi:hypothetical protein